MSSAQFLFRGYDADADKNDADADSFSPSDRFAENPESADYRDQDADGRDDCSTSGYLRCLVYD